MTLGSSLTVARFLFSDFWWLDSMVVEWVSARVGGNLQRYCYVISMWVMSLGINGDSKVLQLF